MTPHCAFLRSGAVEALFYDDLPRPERDRLEAHVPGCAACRDALADLRTITEALAAAPVVAAPPGDDWSAFMRRLDARIVLAAGARPASPARWQHTALLAMAATLALSTTGVVLAVRAARPAAPAAALASPAHPSPDRADAAGFEAVTEEHLERSKLVVLGLAAKDPGHVRATDWQYERALAGRLLSDTRMYRLAAEDRGLGSIASVMRDLELVLLQASLTDDRDPASLTHIQRLIERRDLVAKMDAVSLSGL